MCAHVISSNNTIHIALYNYNNYICYALSTIQKLHASPTLNQLLLQQSDTFSGDDINNDFLIPLILYSKITMDNFDDTYSKVKNALISFTDTYVASSVTKGYSPDVLFRYYYVPIIFEKFPEKFDEIINEVYVDHISLSDLSYVNDVYILGDETYLKHEKDREIFYEKYNNLIKKYSTLVSDRRFVCGTLEIFPNKNYSKGHAVTIIKSKDEKNVNGHNESYFIIDDSVDISPLSVYYKNHLERLYELVIKNIDDLSIAEINSTLADSVFEKSTNRYVLTNKNKFETIHINNKPFDVLKQQYKHKSLNGGYISLSKMWFIIMYFVLVVAIVIVLTTFIMSRKILHIFTDNK